MNNCKVESSGLWQGLAACCIEYGDEPSSSLIG